MAMYFFISWFYLHIVILRKVNNLVTKKKKKKLTRNLQNFNRTFCVSFFDASYHNKGLF